MPGISRNHKTSVPYLKRRESIASKNGLLETKRNFKRCASAPALSNLQSSRVHLPKSDIPLETEQEAMDGNLESDPDTDAFSEESESNGNRSEVFGFQTKAVYEQQSRMTNMMGVLYNGRIHRFFMLDSRGMSSWLPGSYAADAVKREVLFPKYKTKLLRTIIFCKKYNVYFAICHDFTLKVYNRDFHETCKAHNRSMHSLLHLNFNPVTDELIASGVAGTTVWKYAMTDKHIFEIIKPMANYELQPHGDYPHVGGSWCSKVELDVPSQCIFYCSENDLYAYNAQDYRKLFEIHNAHFGTVTSVAYSSSSRVVVTGGVDAEVKVWGFAGGHICTFRGHSKIVTSVVVHPRMPGLVFTSSMDGIIKIWSLDSMDLFYSMNVTPDGIKWMKLTDDGNIWCANVRKIIILKFNPVVSFWGHARCQIVKLNVLEHEGKAKRIMALGEDSSVRLFGQNKINSSALCTVLPPPVVSLLSNVNDVTISRFNNLAFLLLNPTQLWIYTAKTDPACRIAEWDIPRLLIEGFRSSTMSSIAIRQFEDDKSAHRCNQILSRKVTPSPCRCVLAVFSENGFQYQSPSGVCSAKSRHLLLLGLEDGRIVFSDQKERLLYCELKVHKEAVLSMSHELEEEWLTTLCNDAKSHVFQIWSLPAIELQHTVNTSLPPTCYTVANKFLITGHATGHVTMHRLEDCDHVKTDWKDKRPEHRDRILSVKPCKKRMIFCSSSADGVIKIWNLEKVLLADVRLGENLTCCSFLNDNADLILGWKHQLFSIHHKTLGFKYEQDGDGDKWETDSDIYEDPAVRYESLIKRRHAPSAITMKQYLVPYGFVATDQNGDGKIMDVEVKQDQEVVDSECSSEMARAMTETYLSPSSSVSSFKTIDSLFRIKSRALLSARSIDVYDQNDLMPEFGDSPGPTPSESVVSYLEGEMDDVFVEDLDDDIDMLNQTEEGDEFDLGKNLGTAVLVAKAYKKMKKGQEPKFEEIREENGTASRSANKNMKSKRMLKSGMNAAFAVESLKANQRKKSSDNTGQPPSIRRIVKKSRRSSGNAERQRLIPADVSVKFHDEKRQPDAETSEKLDEKLLEKLESMGLKMIPQARPGSATSGDPSAQSLMSQRKKMASAGFPDKSGRRSSNRLKRKYSKSATVRGRKSGKSKYGFLSGAHLASREQAVNFGELSDRNSINVGHSPSSESHLRSYYSPKQRSSPREPTFDADLDISGSENKEFMSSEILNQTQSNNGENGCRKQEGSIRDEKIDEDKDFGIVDMEKLLNKCRGLASGSVDSDDDEDFVIPNLLEYDFHAIYKKDGLQFDENWQNRMLDRYMLLKLQKQQRREAALGKREFLEEERRMKFLSAQPDLMRKLEQPWYEDHETLAKYLLNNSLIRGDSPSQSHVSHTAHSKSSSRPASSKSAVQRGNSDDISEKDGKYRFTIRPRSSRTPQDSDRSKATNDQSPRVVKVTRSKSLGNIAGENKFLAERPRSSASIPGKTRYILVKPDRDRRTGSVRSPTKLEEQLLMQRFPSQHCNVMKSLGRNKDHLPDLSEDEFEELSFRDAVSRPTTASTTQNPRGHMNSTGNASPTLSRQSRRQPPQASSSWKSSFVDGYINPIDIVRRKTIRDHRRKIEINLRSIHT